MYTYYLVQGRVLTSAHTQRRSYMLRRGPRISGKERGLYAWPDGRSGARADAAIVWTD